jgi:hypothetical protein
MLGHRRIATNNDLFLCQNKELFFDRLEPNLFAAIPASAIPRLLTHSPVPAAALQGPVATTIASGVLVDQASTHQSPIDYLLE